MDKNEQKKQRRGPKPRDLIADSPFSIALSRVLRDMDEAKSVIEERGKLRSGTLKSVLESGNPTISTAWAIEDALGLPRGALCAPAAVVSPATEERRPAADPNPLVPGAIRMIAEKPWPLPEARAAADTSNGLQTEVVEGMAESIRAPEDTVLIPVRGQSMEPVILDNQYVVVDWADGGWKGDGGIYVVEVIDTEYATPQIFVKHVFLHGDEYALQSVNTDVEDRIFPVRHVSRMWQVIGTWYMGKSKPAVFRTARPRPVARRQPIYSAVTGANVVPARDPEPINIVFSLQKSLSAFQSLLADAGRHIAAGESLTDYEGLPSLQTTVQSLKDLCGAIGARLASYLRHREDQDHSDQDRPA